MDVLGYGMEGRALASVKPWLKQAKITCALKTMKNMQGRLNPIFHEPPFSCDEFSP
jgi:hypothetical protein